MAVFTRFNKLTQKEWDSLSFDELSYLCCVVKSGGERQKIIFGQMKNRWAPLKKWLEVYFKFLPQNESNKSVKEILEEILKKIKENDNVGLPHDFNEWLEVLDWASLEREHYTEIFTNLRKRALEEMSRLADTPENKDLVRKRIEYEKGIEKMSLTEI